MESISVENTKVDEKGMEMSQHCLGLPTVLRKVLEQISTQKLLELSLVNKMWNFEARSVLRERGNLIASIGSGGCGKEEDCPCPDLEALASALEKARIVPFSGLHFPINNRVACKSDSKESLQPSHKVILDRLDWKYFIVGFGPYYWKNYKYCPALDLVKQILEVHCGVLEDLTLGFANEEFLRPIFQHRSFPRLKSLTIKSWVRASRDESLSGSFIKTLVSCSPNLQELSSTTAAVDLTVNFLEGSSAVLLPRFVLHPLSKPICEGLVDSIRSHELAIFIHDERIDPELLNRFLPQLLEASRTTLRALTIDHLFAVPLMCYGICLENVTNLKIYMNSYRLGEIEPWILALPGGLDFTRLFPKLNQVKILDDYDLDFSSDVIDAFLVQGAAVSRRALPDRATNIRLLDLDLEQCGSIWDSVLPLLAQMFPDVTTVHIKSYQQGALLEDLQEHFPSLEGVTES